MLPVQFTVPHTRLQLHFAVRERSQLDQTAVPADFYLYAFQKLISFVVPARQLIDPVSAVRQRSTLIIQS